MSLHTHYISVRPQVVVYWCSYGFEVSSNYVTNAIDAYRENVTLTKGFADILIK